MALNFMTSCYPCPGLGELPWREPHFFTPFIWRGYQTLSMLLYLGHPNPCAAVRFHSSGYLALEGKEQPELYQY